MKHLTLHQKAIAIVIFVICTVMIAQFYTTTTILLHNYQTLEDAETKKNTTRVLNGMANRLADLDNHTGDWSNWDDAYAFMQGKKADFISSNVVNLTFNFNKVNFIIFLDTEGKLLYGKGYDLKTNTSISLPTFNNQVAALFNTTTTNKTISGLINLPEGILMFSAKPILKGSGDGPSVGSLIFARYLDQEEITALSTITNNKLEITTINKNLPQDYLDAQSQLNEQTSIFIQPLSNKIISGYSYIKDVTNQPIALLRVDNERDIYAQGKRSTIYYLLSFIIIGLLFGIVTWFLIEKLIISRLIKLGKEVIQIGSNPTTDKQLELIGNDEITLFSQQINNMLTAIHHYQTELREAKASVEKEVIERTHELAMEKAKLEASINSSNLGLVMTNQYNEIIKANTAAKTILFSDDRFKHIIQPNLFNKTLTIDELQERLKDIINLKEVLNDCLQKKEPKEFKDISLDERYFRIFISPIYFYEDQVTIFGNVILIEDISESKILERSKDEFFSIASHELRTPLTAIRGNTSLIQQYYQDVLNKDPKLEEMITDIHTSSVRLIGIVNDFLNVSRLEQGRMNFNKENFNPIELIQEVQKEVENLAKEKNLPINFNQENLPPQWVYADKDRVKEILINLSSNAIKYTDEGSITFSVSVENDLYKIYITDTGKGIPVENKNLLFRKFQQANNNILTRDTTKSTGLGLYIAKLLAEGMGATIQLESSILSQGSTFSLTLPVAI
jgi:signal transduction histidine kinase